jgi:flagellar biosynthetic protein FlhB
MNIQLFADDGDKTEKPTGKRRRDARNKGQVVQSKEINSVMILLGVFICIKIFSGYLIKNFKMAMIEPFKYFNDVDKIFKINNINLYIIDVFKSVVLILGPIFLAAAFMGLLASYFQIGFLFTTETLKPNLSRLNFIKGFKNMFSMRALMELGKSLAKLLVLGYIGYSYIRAQANSIAYIYEMNVEQILGYVANVAFNLVIRMSAALFIIAATDYFFQWRQNEKSLKMSKQELKEEYKQSEGNPEIKSKIKQKQREMAMRRMMQDVPKADVVITNPTHYAVAIKYDPNKYSAPYVLAKGQDYLAQRIKSIAKDNGVEIVENKPLARSLYANAEVGDLVPSELYQTVAEVIAYVYNLKGK